ncbi:MAG TPA: CHAT domain-containing protein [Longimicrobium sp.]|jgi:hypothetical protein
MKVLALFSNPPDQTPLRLDKEDKILVRLAREFASTVSLVRQHASEIEDIHSLLINGDYDVLHFSGHGDADGLCLDQGDSERSETVSAARVLSLINLSKKQPLVSAFLSCYSADNLPILADSAPFVITSRGAVSDQDCLIFVEGFYEHLFRQNSVNASFEHALTLMRARGCGEQCFTLSRRHLVRRKDSVYVESRPSSTHDPVIINLDAVRDSLGRFGLSEEEMCHLLARKVVIHHWIFDTARDDAVLPIGRLLFGVFSWTNARDVIYCTKLMKLRADAPALAWQVWSRLMSTYNDLAACRYRSAQRPSDPSSSYMLEEAVALFQHHVLKYMEPARHTLVQLNQEELLPHLQMAITQVETASDQLALGRFREVVLSLELALTNYHTVADGLQPPEDVSPAAT